MASIPTIDLSKLNLGDWKLPEFKLPEFDLPKFELPDFDVPDLPTAEQVTSYVRDAAYVGVGLAAMTVERLQALQQQLIDLVKERVPS